MFFKIQTVQMSQRSLRVKEPTPWPLNQPANKPFLPFYDHFDASLNESSNQGGSSIKILWPFSILNAHGFARSLKVTTFLLSPVRRFCNVISPWPSKTSAAFLTYCDKSFVNSHKHKYPLQAEGEEGGGDTWAFVAWAPGRFLESGAVRPQRDGKQIVPRWCH